MKNCLNRYSFKPIVAERPDLCGCNIATTLFLWCTFSKENIFIGELRIGMNKNRIYRNVEVSKHLSRSHCYKAGYTWTGLDISGHCFLLTWNNLVITEELRPVPCPSNQDQKCDKCHTFSERCLLLLFQFSIRFLTIFHISIILSHGRY